MKIDLLQGIAFASPAALGQAGGFAFDRNEEFGRL